MEALYPGSFDPPTLGHLNIIERCARIFSTLHIVVADNAKKNYAFSTARRFKMMHTISRHLNNVTVHQCNKLIVEFAKELGVPVIIRGIRAHQDFEYEFQLSLFNRGLSPAIETLFMPTDPKYFVLRSSAIRELASLKGDISGMVPPSIVAEIQQHFASK